MTTYYLEVFRDGGWHLIGQYTDRAAAERIATDYRSHGDHVRIITDE